MTISQEKKEAVMDSATAIIIFITEVIGTVAFSVSGTIVAIDHGLDVFGVIFIGCITAVGGGIMRDIMLGAVPPVAFVNPYPMLIAAIASLVVFVVAYTLRGRYTALRARIDVINNIFDAIGLAAFAVMGTENAIAAGYGENVLFCVSLGTVTCIGGGMLRDVMTNSTPYVLKKRIYALASIAGCLFYLLLSRMDLHPSVPTLSAMILVFAIRMLATVFRWSLPKIAPALTDVPKND